MKTQIEMLLEDALEVLDHAELTSVEGGYVFGLATGRYHIGPEESFVRFSPQNPFPIGPIIL